MAQASNQPITTDTANLTPEWQVAFDALMARLSSGRPGAMAVSGAPKVGKPGSAAQRVLEAA